VRTQHLEITAPSDIKNVEVGNLREGRRESVWISPSVMDAKWPVFQAPINVHWQEQIVVIRL
jgi:hypothetical protein